MLSGVRASKQHRSDSRGRRLLLEVIERVGTATQVGAELGRRQSVVSRWAVGERVPDARNRGLLERLYGIPFRSWDEPPQQDGDDAAHGSAA